MKRMKQLVPVALLALLLLPAALFGQEQKTQRGYIDFGFTGMTGEVYGRTNPGDVPFSNGFRPDLLTSKLNTYNDYRNGFGIRKSDMQLDDVLGANSYFRVQSANNGVAFSGLGTLNRNQTVLATAAKYGVYKFQFRYEETPHIFSGTTRTLFTSGGPGVWKVNPALQSALYGVTSTNTASNTTTATNISNAINSAVAGTLVPGVAGAQLFTQQDVRRTGTGSGIWNFTPDWNAFFTFSREHQVGTRPLGMVMGNGAGAYHLDMPEPIDYHTNTVKVGTEFGQKHWDGMLAYQGSFFSNNIQSMLVDNPFSTVYTNSSVGPQTARDELYPTNRYQQFMSQGAADLGKYVRLMANITPGLMTQNEPFQPVTTNPAPLIADASLANYNPATNTLLTNSLNGRVNTLAMNYTAVFTAIKNLQVTAKYQHYTYNNNTPEMLVPVMVGDTAIATGNTTSTSGNECLATADVNGKLIGCGTEQSSFTRKTFELAGTYFITKKNSAKVGYQREWMDRTNRNVNESIENTVYAATDLQLYKNVTLRVSGRHQNRNPQDYDTSLGFAVNSAPPAATDIFYARMYDQAARIRNRGDVLLQWNATDKLSVSGFWSTLQDNFNVKGGVNSATPLGDLSHSKTGCQIGATNYLGTAGVAGGADPIPVTTCTAVPLLPVAKNYGNYYAYGLLNSVGRSLGADVNYAATKNVVLFAEYIWEKNRGDILDGYQRSTSNCALTTGGFWPSTSCDPINDLITRSKDRVNTYIAGADMSLTKKVNVSVYYSLSAAQSYLDSEGVNCQIGTSNTTNPYCQQHYANWSLDTRVNPAITFGYPENVSRTHEVGLIAKFKLTNNVTPKFQYIYQQYDMKDFQTSAINPYSFVGIGIDPGAAIGATVNGAPLPTGAAPFSSTTKFLSLGADTPSYRAHIFTAGLEYRF